MITLPTGTRIWIIAGVTDMRCGFNGLASKVQNTLKDDPFSGHIFVFRGRSGKMVKILWADRDGLCLFAKRLEQGRFVWPVSREGKVHLTPAQLSMLLEGIALPDDIEQLKALLVAQQAIIVRLSGEITGYAREIGSLRALVAKLPRMLFGRSSEKNREKIEKKIAQAEKRITDLQNRLGEAHSQLTSMAGDAVPKTSDSPTRKALPATLPRDRQVISPAETECPVCSGKLKPLGESISGTTGYYQHRVQGNRNGPSKTGLQSVRLYRAGSAAAKTHRAQLCQPSIWRELSWRSSLSTCRCIVSRKSTPGRAWS